MLCKSESISSIKNAANHVARQPTKLILKLNVIVWLLSYNSSQLKKTENLKMVLLSYRHSQRNLTGKKLPLFDAPSRRRSFGRHVILYTNIRKDSAST